MTRSPVVLAAVLVGAFGPAFAMSPQAPPQEPPPRVVVGAVAGPQAAPSRDVVPQNVRRIPIGTATLSGTVVDAATGRPLPSARVSISGPTAPAPGAARGAVVPGSGGGAGTGGGGGRGAGGGGRGGLAQAQGLTSTAALAAAMVLSRSTVTDARGRFTFESLPAGQFNVSVFRDQYLTVNYGQTRPNRPGTPVRIAEGASEAITIRMPRGGVIAGSVYGDDGAPEVGARVQAMRFSSTGGVRRLLGASGASTDDRGAYRIYGLQPGEYVVAVTPSMTRLAMNEQAEMERAAFEAALKATLAGDFGGNRPTSVAIAIQNPQNNQNPTAGFAPTYFPSTASARDASKIAVGPGEEKLGVDVTALPVRAGNIAGTVAGLPGPEFAAQVSLVSDDPLSGGSQQIARTSPDGTFMLRNVMPGRYTVMAQAVRNGPPPAASSLSNVVGPPPQPNAAERYWGRAEVVVEGQSTPHVAIVMQPPKSVSGTVVADMQVPFNVSRMTVSLGPTPLAMSMPLIGGMPSATVQPDGRFTIAGVVPGTYVVRAGGPARSAMLNGVDVLDFPLEVGDRDLAGMVITLSDRTTNLSGTLTDPLGQDPTGYTIVIAPSDRNYWVPGGRRIRTARPDAEGRYRVAGLPAGSYMIAAVTDLEPGGEGDPEFLQAMAGASIAVTLTEGGSAVQDIRVAR